jgi:hypothetical protein
LNQIITSSVGTGLAIQLKKFSIEFIYGEYNINTLNVNFY